jgi:hypothetical protein
MPLKCVCNWVTFVHLAGFAAACSSRVVHRGDKVVISKWCGKREARARLSMVTTESNLVIFITFILLFFSNSFSRVSCLHNSYLLLFENKEGWGSRYTRFGVVYGWCFVRCQHMELKCRFCYQILEHGIQSTWGTWSHDCKNQNLTLVICHAVSLFYTP